MTHKINEDIFHFRHRWPAISYALLVLILLRAAADVDEAKINRSIIALLVLILLELRC